MPTVPSKPNYILNSPGTAQVRLYHTDLKVPDYSAYRRDSVKQSNRKDDSAEKRKAFTYLLAGSKWID